MRKNSSCQKQNSADVPGSSDYDCCVLEKVHRLSKVFHGDRTVAGYLHEHNRFSWESQQETHQQQ